MKILYITQYFYPEVGATTNRALANVRHFTQKGHEVTVLTEMPNHPKGIIFKEYKNRIFVKEKMDGFLIKRLWVFTSQKKNFLTRLLFYLSFSVIGSIYSVISREKYDVVYVTSPPLFVGLIGLVLKQMHPSIKLIFEARDLWPDSAIELGELKNKSLINLSSQLEKKLYEKASAIITVTENLKEKIIQKGFPESKVHTIRNGTDIEIGDTDLAFTAKNQMLAKKICFKYKFKHPIGILSNFKVVYAGNLGIAQNLFTLLEAAKILNNDNVHFMFIGAGPEEGKLKISVKELNLSNVSFIGEVPRKNIRKYLNFADCGIIPLKDIPMFESALPSKIFDYMSVNLPILLGVKGIAKNVVESSETGLYFEPENSISLADQILKLKRNKTLYKKLSSNGQDYVSANYDRQKLAGQIERILLAL